MGDLDAETSYANPEDGVILQKLAKLGEGGIWLWMIFIMAATPGLFNGAHVSSYVFLGELPEAHWCHVTELSTWTETQMRNVSVPGGLDTLLSCGVYDWNYAELYEMGYQNALNYTRTQDKPAIVSCEERGYHMAYQQKEGVSIVPEWDLVCDNLVLRSTVQVALSIGKFIGAFVFGILSDKYGRKKSFLCGAVLYIISAPLSASAQGYVMFIIMRVLIGASGAGAYHSAYTILTEIAGPKHRAWMSITYNMTYPLGMMFLALTAFYVPKWRDLQLAISVPTVILLLHCWFLPESPRWLISKGRRAEAYRIVFGREKVSSIQHLGDIYNDIAHKEGLKQNDTVQKLEVKEVPKSLAVKLKESMRELTDLYSYSELRNRLFIVHYCWCATSLSYYALALNGDNFSANRYIYVALTGAIEAPSYIIPLPMLRWLGRRKVSFILFLIAGISLMSILAIPQESTMALIAVGLGGRLCVSAVFSVVILQTSELFPTTCRNSAIGTSSTMAHVGSISAPYIVDLLGAVAWFIPTTICGIMALVACFLILLLPETKGRELRDTAEQIMQPGEKKVSIKNICT